MNDFDFGLEDVEIIEDNFDLDGIELPEISLFVEEDEGDFDSVDEFIPDLDLELEDLSLEVSLVPSRSVPAKLVIGIDKSLEIYQEKLINLLDWAKSSHLSSQTALIELSKRLTSYYNENNNGIIPVVDFDRSEGGATPSSFILSSIRNRVSVVDIMVSLKERFSSQRIVKSDGTYFKFQGSVESRIRDFIIQIKNFYETELSVFEQSQDSIQVLDSFSDMHNYVLATKEIIGSSIPTIYPDLIDLGQKTFLCGSCGEIVEYVFPFMKASITNSDNTDWFFLVMPTLESCTECGTINILPANYFDKISQNLKELFNAGPVNDLKTRLRELCGEFKVVPYELSSDTIVSAITSDMEALFKVSVDEVLEVEESKGYDFDYGLALKSYKDLVNSFSVNISRDIEDSLFSGDTRLSESALKNFRNNLVRSLCGALGSDYTLLKERAISSIIYFLEDTIPYVSSPYAMLALKKDYLLNRLEPDVYEKWENQWKRVIESLIKYRDFFSFIPLIQTSSAHSKFKYYSIDSSMKEFLDYCSDNIILYSLRSEIMSLSKVKKVMNPLLSDTSNLSLGLKKLQKIVVGGGDSFHMAMTWMLTDFIYKDVKKVEGYDYSDLLKAASNKDLYSLAKSLFDSSESYESEKYIPGLEKLRKELEKFREDVENKTRLEFYYGEHFSQEELETVDSLSIDIPIVPERDGLSVAEYFHQIRSKKTLRSSANHIKHNDFFEDNVENYFELLIKFLSKDVCVKDALFMDILKALACNEISDVLLFFGIGESMSKVFMMESDYFVFNECDADTELAKMIVCDYPFQDDDLCLLVSNHSEEDVFDALLSEIETLSSELKDASPEIRSLIERKLPIPLNDLV